MGIFVTIGRHFFTDIQKELLRRAGLTEEVGRIEMVKNPQDVVQKAKELGASAIIVQGLPLSLLVPILQGASKECISVYQFRSEPVGIFPTEEEAENAGDVVIPAREGGYRVLKTKALQKVKEIRIIVEDVASID